MKIYYCLLFILFLSCQQNTKTEKKDLNSGKLISREFEFNETFDVLDMTIVGDYLVIVSSQSDTLIHIYSLPDLKLVNKMGMKGDSPSDLTYASLIKGSNKNLYIGGFNGGKDIKEFKIEDYKLTEARTLSMCAREPLNDAYIINDSTLLYNSIFDLMLRKINMKDCSSYDICKYTKDSHRESFFYSNKGKMGVNKSTMVYAYFYKDQIDFIDLNGNLINRIVGKNTTPSISLDNFNKNYISYVNLYAGDQNFYLLYRGKAHEDYINNNLTDRLEVYDNKGKMLKEYSFKVPPIIFAVDEKRNVLYGYNGMYKDVLLVYEI